MTISRQKLNISIAATGANGDTGAPANGFLHSIRWYPTVTDTGANATMYLMKKVLDTDTAEGEVIFSISTGLQAGFTACPRQNVSQAISDDTGNFVPWALSGERLHAKVASTSPIAGRLYIYLDGDE